MTNETETMEPLRLLNPKDVRRAAEVEVDLGDGTMIRARKMDMTLLVFEGQLSMPMLTAVQRMVDMPDASPIERLAVLGAEGRSMVDMLRKHASVVSITPRIVLEDSTDENVIPATYLNTLQLMAIWNATAVTPKFGGSQAARFRGRAGADVAPVAPAREDVPPTALDVVTADGRAVEYIGQ